jgi:hypothetical protein
MSATIQASAYWEGYATALMQVVDNSMPPDYAPDDHKYEQRRRYTEILKQHNMGLHWVKFFLGEEDNG